MMPYYYHHYSFGLWDAIPMVVFWILIITLLVFLFRGRRRFYHHDRDFPGRNRALDVLNERYAKGEINKEEYEQKKKDIQA